MAPALDPPQGTVARERLIHRELLQILALTVLAVVAFVVTQELEGSSRQLRQRDSGLGAESVASLVDPGRPHVHPDHPFDVVLNRFSEADGVLPVVSRTDATRVEGVITLESIMASVRRRSPREVS